MRVGDKVISKKKSFGYTIGNYYKIIKINKHEPIAYTINTDKKINVYFTIDEFKEFFYTDQEMRKLKLKKLNKL